MNTLEIVPEALPSVALADRESLPIEPGIYFLLSETGEVLYVGKTGSLAARWKGKAHHRYEQVADLQGVRIAWLIVSDLDALDGIEQSLISALSPSLNRSRRLPTTLGIDGPERRMISIELPVDLLERLDRLARLHHRSRTGEITQALEDYVKRQPEKEATR